MRNSPGHALLVPGPYRLLGTSHSVDRVATHFESMALPANRNGSLARNKGCNIGVCVSDLRAVVVARRCNREGFVSDR